MKFASILLILIASQFAVTAHEHYGVGLAVEKPDLNPQPDTPLGFVGENPEERTFHLLARPKGFRPVQRCGGYYMLNERLRTLFPNDAFSLTAHFSGEQDEAFPGHAHPGAQIWAEIVCVKGPPGASFGYWEENRDRDADTPTVSFTTNTEFEAYGFVLSEGPDEEGEDPGGHIHNRSWTATHPGEYRVGIRFVDRSTNRPSGQPWHAPSRVYTLRFVAGPDFQPVITQEGGGMRLTWPSMMGTFDAGGQTGVVFRVMRATGLSPANWEQIGSVTGTTAATATFIDPSPPPQRAFYQLSYDWGWSDEGE
jgi:hypothetical protein